MPTDNIGEAKGVPMPRGWGHEPPRAFPSAPAQDIRYGSGDRVSAEKGMTLRDWFAGQALAGITAGYPNTLGSKPRSSDETNEATVNVAYALADAMMARRDK
jgi:hypothetical protein